jgi:hypothetical protein
MLGLDEDFLGENGKRETTIAVKVIKSVALPSAPAGREDLPVLCRDDELQGLHRRLQGDSTKTSPQNLILILESIE